MVERIYTPEEVAELLSVTPKTVKDWLRAGKLKGSKLGKLWRVQDSDIQRFMDENSTR
jgi:excisionase family DNA binding protein